MHNPLQNTMSRWDWIRIVLQNHMALGESTEIISLISVEFGLRVPPANRPPFRPGKMLGGGAPGGTGPTGGGAPPGPGGAMVPAMPGSMSQMPGWDDWDGWGLAGVGAHRIFFWGGEIYIGDTIFEQE